MFRNLTLLIVFLAFCVIVAGTFVRASDASLACPDWPGCFGQLIPPDSLESLPKSDPVFAGVQLDLGKSRISMSRRYLAGLTGGMVVLLWLGAFFVKVHRKAAILLSTALLGAAITQVLVDWWAVQFKLMPILVSGHFLAGLLVLCLAFWIFLRVNPKCNFVYRRSNIGFWAKFSFIVLLVQITLGSWVGSNYAGLACPDFPTCLGSWWPSADFFSGFSILQGTGLNYQGGVLSHDARVAVNWVHRIGAFVSFLTLGWLALLVSSSSCPRRLRKAGVLLSALLLTQIALGIGTVLLRLPVPVAVGHSGVGALLLLTVVYINFWSGRELDSQPQDLSGVPAEAEALQVDSMESGVVEVPIEPVAVEKPEPVGLYQRLSTQLKRTRSGLTDVFAAIPLGKKEIDAELLEDIESTLLMADIGVDATREIIDNLTQNMQRNQLNDSDALTGALRENLLDMLKPCDLPLNVEPGGKTFVILVVGVNGVGKTTTIGKLTKRFQSKGLSVMLAAGDTFRAAAVEQLQAWGERNDVPVVAQYTGADSASVVFDALQSAQARGIDVLIADTAGRLHTKDNLMEELRKVKRILAKIDPDAPHEVLLVVDAGTGQNALSQAEQFNQIVGVTGIALTKLDGTAKGGVIFAMAKQLNIPIRFIGIGEGVNDLQDFHAEDFIDALFEVDRNS